MPKNELEKWEEELENFIRESFSDGRVECELRLSECEVDYIKERYRAATFEPFTQKKDDKTWFIVNLGIY